MNYAVERDLSDAQSDIFSIGCYCLAAFTSVRDYFCSTSASLDDLLHSGKMTVDKKEREKHETALELDSHPQHPESIVCGDE